MRPKLIISQGKEKPLLRRHPWVFSGAVNHIKGSPAEGDVVDVYSHDGSWLATGLFHNDSIICKVLSFDTPQVDSDFFRLRLLSAINYRRRLGFFNSPLTNVFRLIHAEGDSLPGLVADWYAGNLVLQAHSVGMHRLFPLFTHLLQELLAPLGLVSIFDKSSATLPGTITVTDGFLFGSQSQEWEVSENALRMIINPFEGQKTGFFIDQRENRALVASLAKDCRVLNCFGYTGGFSLAALKGGASYVETVDISRKAIDLCNRNVQLNFPDGAPHKGTVADVLHFFQTPSPVFDFIILDPPAFAKNHRALQQGLKGYRKINQAALENIADGGLLMTFSCSQAVSKEDFQTMVFTAASNAHRRLRLRIVRQLPHAPDHPVSIFHPEGEYLKGLLLQVES